MELHLLNMCHFNNTLLLNNGTFSHCRSLNYITLLLLEAILNITVDKFITNYH